LQVHALLEQKYTLDAKLSESSSKLGSATGDTSLKKLRIVILGLVRALRDREWLLNDGQIQNPSAQS
jgi:hypothetical protein